MKFKKLFIEEKDVKKEEPKYVSKFPETNRFPSTSGATVMEAQPAPPIPTMGVPLECAPHMDAIMKNYEAGFASLNKPGIEFFEFFEAVVNAGAENPGSYKMALKMLSGMEKSMTKDSLITQSQYYIDELTKVHAGYNAEGLKKKNDLLADKNAEGQKLTSDIQLLQDQITSITNQLSAKKVQLSQIDAKYQPKLNEFDCKITANDEAKNRILGTINNVVNGIKINL